MLKEQIHKELNLFGLDGFEQPIFYHCNIGIRFEIGVGDVYGNNGIPSKEYIDNALERAMTIYNNGIKLPSILVWRTYPRNNKERDRLKTLFQEKIAPISPEEEFSKDVEVSGEKVNRTEFYWDLKGVNMPIQKLFREIILGDLGGVSEFVSSVYLFDTQNHVMLHLYDDRGLDITAYNKNVLMPLYKNLNGWILDYDRKEIDKIFL